ncbi:MAG: RHS repeat-associated core domain-containing protein [Pseudomonadota bacterium]
MTKYLVATFAAALLLGPACQCGGPDDPDAGSSTDATARDTGSSDRAAQDVGGTDRFQTRDATVDDVSGLDVTTPDAGGDAATGVDASGTDAMLTVDASGIDSGSADAALVDAIQVLPDASADAAMTVDAATRVDAGTADVGSSDAALADTGVAVDATACSPRACASLGTTQCQGNAVVTCEDQGGCLVWSDPVDCVSPDYCNGGSCNQLSLPNPADIAPPLDPFKPHDPLRDTAFLYDGPNPIQFGVASGVIEHRRVALLSGRVLLRATDAAQPASPLMGARVSVHGAPELGYTFSRDDGRYDLVVNGGDRVVLAFEASGVLSAQQHVRVGWQDSVAVPDQILVPVDTIATAVDTGAVQWQTIRGSTVVDDDGSRTAQALVPPGTTATMTLADGSTQTLTHLTVRVTEYSVGADGEQAMPATLPPTSGYTYCVEYSADEALAVGASRVDFDQPLIHYNENFIGFDTGTEVPTGYYDRQRAVWVPSPDGRVIEILSEAAGSVELDVDGSGLAADATALAALGVTTEELQQLAVLYQPGDTLWRVEIPHFTPWDHNWPYVPPPEANRPRRRNQRDREQKRREDRCDRGGCVIDEVSGNLSERVAIPGTPFSLNYSSQYINDMRPEVSFQIFDDDETISPALKKTYYYLTGAAISGDSGRYLVATPGLRQRYVWDGNDPFGRPVAGTALAKANISYYYEPVYAPTMQRFNASFASVADATQPGFSERWGRSSNGLVARVREEWVRIPNPRTDEPRALGLGGWRLDVHHRYDNATSTVWLGSGDSYSAQPNGQGAIQYFAGTGAAQTAALAFTEGALATTLKLALQTSATSLNPMAIDASGQIYIGFGNIIVRIDNQQRMYRVAGCLSEDRPCTTQPVEGEPALGHTIPTVEHLAVDRNGNIYLLNVNKTWMISADGVLHRHAGFPSVVWPYPDDLGDGGPALEANMAAKDLCVGPNQEVYLVSDSLTIGVSRARIRRVDADGMIETVLGGNSTTPGLTVLGPSNPVVPAQRAMPETMPNHCAVAPDGTLYFTTSAGGLYELGLDGNARLIAGRGASLAEDGVLAREADLKYIDQIQIGPGGRPYFLHNRGSTNPRYVAIRGIDKDGRLFTVAGSWTEFQGTPTLADTPVRLTDLTARSFVFNEDGFVLMPAKYRLIGFKLPALLGSTPWIDLQSDEFFVPSQDGRRLFVFDVNHRHVRTLNAYNLSTVYSFDLDDQGRLLGITDAEGNFTQIVHDASGTPAQIIAPNGEQTQLSVDSNGYLDAVDSARGLRTFACDDRGLLTSATDAKGGLHHFSYDVDDRLIEEIGPDTGVTTFSRDDAQVIDPDTGAEVDGAVATRTDANGRVVRYEIGYRGNGDVFRRRLSPSGTSTTRLEMVGGQVQLRYDNGASIDSAYGPDPRWGMVAARVTRTIMNGAGLTATLLSSASVELSDPVDKLSMTRYTETNTLNGDAYTLNYNVAAGTLTTTDPTGSVEVLGLDAQGRVITRQRGSSAELAVFYNSYGQLESYTRGTLEWTNSYDPASGRLSSAANELGGVYDFSYDAAGQLASRTLPDGRVIGFDHNAAGQLAQLTLPGPAAHSLSHDANGKLVEYQPPGLNPGYQRSYDDEGLLIGSTLPGGRSLMQLYDPQGRIARTDYAEAVIDQAYTVGASAEWRSSYVRKADGASQTTRHLYSSGVLSQIVSEGVAEAQVQYAYSNALNFSRLVFDSGADHIDLPLVSDASQRLVGYGDFTVERNGPAGLANQYSDGVATPDLAHDEHGRLVQKTLTVNAAVVYDLVLVYEGLSRVAQKTETMGAWQRSLDYSYDDVGQLLDVSENSSSVEAYSYDDRGNRLGRSLGGGSVEDAVFDLQDRIIVSNGSPVTVDIDGFTTQRAGWNLGYATRGELLSADDGNTTVDYMYDALGRRVARDDGVSVTTYHYGYPGRRSRLLAERGPDGLLAFYYHDERGALLAFDRDGSRIYVATDHLGSPRLLVAADGAVVREIDYDAFGRRTVLTDTRPELPDSVGFAGGLYDPRTGLLRFGWRDYDPELGRWLARDPAFFAGKQTNLYAYVHNDPVGHRDPTGLICVGGSLYKLFGGGGQLCATTDGISACAEIGLGYGEDVSLDLAGDLAEDGTSVKAEVGLDVGPLSIGAKGRLTDCGKLSFEAGGGIGPLGDKATWDGQEGWDHDGPGLSSDLLDYDPEAFFDQVRESMTKSIGFSDIKGGVSGKVAAEGCVSVGF